MPGPRAARNLQMPHPRDWQGGQIPRSSPGGGVLGAAGIDWYITAICLQHVNGKFKSMFGTPVDCFFPTFKGSNMVRVIKGKILYKCSEGKQKLLRVSGRFELSRVRVTEGKITVNVWRKSRGNRFWFELARVRVIGSQPYHQIWEHLATVRTLTQRSHFVCVFCNLFCALLYCLFTCYCWCFFCLLFVLSLGVWMLNSAPFLERTVRPGNFSARKTVLNLPCLHSRSKFQ